MKSEEIVRGKALMRHRPLVTSINHHSPSSLATDSLGRYRSFYGSSV